MLDKSLALLAGASLLVLSAPARTETAADTAALEYHQKAAATESEKLAALFAKSDEDNLRRNPINGLFRGDKRYAVENAHKKPVNGDEKVRSLVEEGLVKGAAPAKVEEPVAEEAPAEEAAEEAAAEEEAE